MNINVNGPNGGWYVIEVNGVVVAMTKTQKLAATIAADIQTRIMLGRNPGV